jgi:hypothetical protein
MQFFLDMTVERSIKCFVNMQVKATTLGIPWRDSISRPQAPVSSVAGGDDTTSV